VGVQPTKPRPLMQWVGMVEPSREVTVWCWTLWFSQRTVPPGPTVTVSGLKAMAGASTMFTVAMAGPPATTSTVPCMVGWNWQK